jgi:hypothetical protein
VLNTVRVAFELGQQLADWPDKRLTRGYGFPHVVRRTLADLPGGMFEAERQIFRQAEISENCSARQP